MKPTKHAGIYRAPHRKSVWASTSYLSDLYNFYFSLAASAAVHVKVTDGLQPSSWGSAEKPSPRAVPIGTGTPRSTQQSQECPASLWRSLCSPHLAAHLWVQLCSVPWWHFSSHFSAFHRLNSPVVLSFKALSKLLSSLYSSISTATFHKTLFLYLYVCVYPYTQKLSPSACSFAIQPPASPKMISMLTSGACSFAKHMFFLSTHGPSNCPNYFWHHQESGWPIRMTLWLIPFSSLSEHFTSKCYSS